jgi:uncharacterized small protein (DUF1192 family)
MEKMDPEELEPQPKKSERPGPRDLESLSIEELEDCISEMEAEIARMREAIAAKKRLREGAETLFRK